MTLPPAVPTLMTELVAELRRQRDALRLGLEAIAAGPQRTPRTTADYREALGEAVECAQRTLLIADSPPCHACTGSGFDSTDPEDASRCLRCDGTGVEPEDASAPHDQEGRI
jgi:DnaJ-class molecular chaperone